MKSYTTGILGLKRPAKPAAAAKASPAPSSSPPPASSEPTARAAAAPRLNLVEHPLAQQALAQLRDRHTPPALFRRVSNQLLLLLLVEATRDMRTREVWVETWAGEKTGRAPAMPVVLLTVARAGLGLANDVAASFPNLRLGTLAIDRTEGAGDPEPRLLLPNAPALGEATLVLADPVIGSGVSTAAAINLLRRSGATQVAVVAFVASLPGLSLLQRAFPDCPIWTAAIDTELDGKRGPIPGVGDFAERLYG